MARPMRPEGSAARFEFLDVIRGLAALAVAVEHACEICLPGLVEVTARYFHLGPFLLPLFMMVSGFVIPASLERSGSNARFWIARIFRLYPLYWFNLALLYGVYRVAPSMTAFDPGNRWHWLANMTMLQEFLRVPHANPVFWTLTAEFTFYLLCSLLFRFGLLRRTGLIVWMGLALFGIAGTVFPLVLGLRFPAGYAFLFLSALFGMVFYRLHLGHASRRQLAGLLAALLIVSAGVAFLNFTLFPRQDSRFTFTSVFLAWVAAFVVFLLFFAWRRPMPRVLLGLGAISYSVYLLHPVVLRLMPGELGALQFIALTVVITLTAASATYLCIERPFLRLGQVLARRVRPNPSGATGPLMGAQQSAAVC